MEKLHLVESVQRSDPSLAVMKSDWASFASDPAMRDVFVYFARHVFAARLHLHAVQFILDAYKVRALRSVRKHLNDGPNGVSDSLLAAILVLTVLDVGISFSFPFVPNEPYNACPPKRGLHLPELCTDTCPAQFE